jgi:hypothetical protein
VIRQITGNIVAAPQARFGFSRQSEVTTHRYLHHPFVMFEAHDF